MHNCNETSRNDDIKPKYAYFSKTGKDMNDANWKKIREGRKK